jgi:hypothetical protein
LDACPFIKQIAWNGAIQVHGSLHSDTRFFVLPLNAQLERQPTGSAVRNVIRSLDILLECIHAMSVRKAQKYHPR